MSVYDEDDINNDDHVDDIYAEKRLSPGEFISEVCVCVCVYAHVHLCACIVCVSIP